jgi:hypothetical protein
MPTIGEMLALRQKAIELLETALEQRPPTYFSGRPCTH